MSIFLIMFSNLKTRAICSCRISKNLPYFQNHHYYSVSQYSTAPRHKISIESSNYRKKKVKLKIKPYEELLKVLEARERNLCSQNVIPLKEFKDEPFLNDLTSQSMITVKEFKEETILNNLSSQSVKEKEFKEEPIVNNSKRLTLYQGKYSVDYSLPKSQLETQSSNKLKERKNVKTSKKSKILNSMSTDNQKKLEESTKLGYILNTLKSYIEVCINADEVEKAQQALIKYGTKYKKKYKADAEVDVDLYNLLIFGWAQKGCLDKVKQIFSIMKEKEIKPNLDSYSGYLECIGKNKFLDISEIQFVMKDMKVNGFSHSDILHKCKFIGDRREKVLEVLGFVDSNFCSLSSYVKQPYSCKLLEKLNDLSYGRGGRHLSLCLSKEEITKLAEVQMDVESKYNLDIKSVDAVTDVTDDILKHREYLRECEEMWRMKLTDCLKNLKSLEKQAFGFHNMSIYPYLAVIDTDVVVTLLLQEVRIRAENGEFFSLTESIIHRDLGAKVMNHYFVWLKKKNQITDKVLFIYKKYLSYLMDSELYYQYTPREYWEYLKEMYPSGPTIDIAVTPWSSDILTYIGRYLYDILRSNIAFNANSVLQKTPNKIMSQAIYTVYEGKGVKLSKQIRIHPLLCKLYREAKLDNILFDATLVPMVVPPKPWVKYDSGSLLISKTDFIRFPGNPMHQVKNFFEVPSSQLHPCFDALNSLSLCPWIINKPILDLVIDVFRNGGNEELEIPLRPESIPSAPKIVQSMSQKEKNVIQKQKLEQKKMKNEVTSLRFDCLYKLSIANHFRDKIFWFPHNFDFRGRVYPTPPHFNHLGNDMSRSILLFAEGQPLGAKGLDWLKIHLINLTGFKKRAPNEERLKYANEMIPEILDSADYPFEGKQWWKSSDKPWQTLACCKEIANALRHPNPSEYVSHFAIHQDGSCNGLQHYAALGRDELGAIEVNLHPSDAPQDVYSGVAALVEKERQREAAEGIEVAKQLEGFVRRKVVKQTVMTFVYGVTPYGAKLQILKQLKDIPEFPQKYCHEAAVYLMKKTFFSIREMFTATKQIQDWFTECAEQITRISGDTLEWVTPLGLPVIQPYHKETSVRSTAHLISQEKEPYYKSKYEPYQLPNIRKQKNAFAPNFIHSLDSTHMMMTALFCQRKGITFVSVHDCYWTHPSTVEIMNKICREQFVSLHKEPILENLSSFFLDKYARVVNENIKILKQSERSRLRLKDILTKVPNQGTFDLDKVLDSEYFFS